MRGTAPPTVKTGGTPPLQETPETEQDKEEAAALDEESLTAET